MKGIKQSESQRPASRQLGRQGAFVSTDPYRPPVWATALDNTPFIVKCSEELPAAEGGSCYPMSQSHGRRDRADSHIETTQDVAKFNKYHCHKTAQ
jgi:hypothetical protein